MSDSTANITDTTMTTPDPSTVRKVKVRPPEGSRRKRRKMTEEEKAARPKRVKHPTKRYPYKCLEPKTFLSDIVRQMQLSHRYNNCLVEVELVRRKAVHAVLAGFSPELKAALAKLDALQVEIDAGFEEVRRDKMARQAAESTPELKKKMDDLIARRNSMYGKISGMQEKLYKRPDVKKALEPSSDAAAAAIKVHRDNLVYDDGLTDHNYLAVNQDRKRIGQGRPPKFQRWDGDGRCSVVINNGMPVSKLFQPNSYCYFVGYDPIIFSNNATEKERKQARRNMFMRFRVDTSQKHGKPLMAEVPIFLHRPLPDHMSVRRIDLFRTRQGKWQKWEVQFVLRGAVEFTDAATEGVVGVDINYRVRPDGGLRVATYAGSDDHVGHLILPERYCRGWRILDQMHSERKLTFNNLRQSLLEFRRTEMNNLPEWWRNLTTYLFQWNSPARMVNLFRRWTDNRWNGDEAAYNEVCNWYDDDVRRWSRESNLKARLLRFRRNEILDFVAEIRQRYGLIRVEDIDWSQMQDLPPMWRNRMPEAVRYNRKIAAPGLISASCCDRVPRHEKVPPQYTTLRCHDCGHIQDRIDRTQVDYRCAGCGKVWDQDVVAAFNIRDALPAQPGNGSSGDGSSGDGETEV